MIRTDELGNEVLTPEQQEQESRGTMDRWMKKRLTLEVASQVLVGIEPYHSRQDTERDLHLLPHAFEGSHAWLEKSDEYTKLKNFEAFAEDAEVDLRNAGYTEPRTLSDWLKCAQICEIFVPWAASLGVGVEKRGPWWHKHVTLEESLEIAKTVPPVPKGKDQGYTPVCRVADLLADRINKRAKASRGERRIQWKSVYIQMTKEKMVAEIRNVAKKLNK